MLKHVNLMLVRVNGLILYWCSYWMIIRDMYICRFVPFYILGMLPKMGSFYDWSNSFSCVVHHFRFANTLFRFSTLPASLSSICRSSSYFHLSLFLLELFLEKSWHMIRASEIFIKENSNFKEVIRLNNWWRLDSFGTTYTEIVESTWKSIFATFTKIPINERSNLVP